MTKLCNYRSESYFKILRPMDGQFSTGGNTPGFSNRGKVWRNIGFLKNHLNQLHVDELRKYDKCVIIQLVTQEFEEGRRPVSHLVDEMLQRRSDKEQASKRAHEAHQKKRELEQLAQLKAKYEGK